MKKVVALLLGLLMLVSPFTAFAAEGPQYSNGRESEIAYSRAYMDLLDQADGKYNDNDVVDLIIELNEDYFSNYGRNLRPEELRTDAGLNAQVDFAKRANADALATIERSYPDFVLDYELNVVMLGLTGKASFATAKALTLEGFVKKVSIAAKFDKPTLERDFEVRPFMDTSVEIIKANEAWRAGYKGEGTVSAVIDSGFQLDHPAFYLTDNSTAKLSKAFVDEKIAEEINVGKYYKAKVPFAYNYADKNDKILEEGVFDSHGQHVAGTVLGNKILKDPVRGTEDIQGVAPEAQLLAMRVFGQDKSTTNEGIYLKAIDDAVILKADSINMSLGSPAGTTKYISDDMNAALQRAADIGCVVSISAGNNGTFAYRYNDGLPFADNPDYGVVGAPSASALGISVASLENTTMRALGLVIKNSEGEIKVFHNPVEEPKFKPEFREVVNVGQGLEENLKDVNLEGKYALVERGGNSFGEKVFNAQNANAAGVIIYNHEAGGEDLINMSLGDLDINIPSTFVPRSTGLAILKDIDNTKVSITNEMIRVPNPNAGKLSEFSSWGPTVDGVFKPEILAPGGNIYSLANENGNAKMSGTSMAAPHVAGGILLVRERVNKDFPNLSGFEKYRLIKNLLMSTAYPHRPDEENAPEVITSPRHQGAGIMRLDKAITSNVIVTSPDTGYSAKALGEVGNKFSFDVEVHNYGNEPVTYNYYANITTDKVENGKFTLEPRFLKATDKQELTVAARSSRIVTINVDISEFDEELKSLMKNGYYVEGFVMFESEDAMEVSFPFVGFRGSYENVPVLEAPININPNPFYGGINSTGFLGQLGEKWFDFVGKENYFDEESPYKFPMAMSPNGDGTLDFMEWIIVALRNFEDAHFKVFKADEKFQSYGGELFTSKSLDGYKNYYDDRNNYQSEYVDTFSGLDANGNVLPDGTYVIRSYVKAVSPADVEYKYQTQDYPLIIDTVAPVLEGATIDGNVLTLKCSDDRSGVMEAVAYYFDAEDKIQFISADENGQLELPEGLAHKEITIELYDHAMNFTSSRLDTLLGEVETVTVTFVLNNSEDNVKVDVPKGEKVNVIMPTREGYVFSGWFVDEALTTPFNLETKLTEDITLYAKWTALGDITDPELRKAIEKAIDIIMSLDKLSDAQMLGFINRINLATSIEEIDLIVAEARKLNDSLIEIPKPQPEPQPELNPGDAWEIIFGPGEKTNTKPVVKEEPKKDHALTLEVRLTIGEKAYEKSVDGLSNKAEMDVAPYIKDGRTMLPIRFVAEALGFDVEWDNDNRTVILKDKEFTVEIPVDTNKIIVNGKTYESDVQPEMVSDRTMLPVANIARALGLVDGEDILWNNDTREVVIKRVIK